MTWVLQPGGEAQYYLSLVQVHDINTAQLWEPGLCNRNKIAKGVTGWVTRGIMICDLPNHGKMQPNQSNPMGLHLYYMGECQVFNGIWSDIYDLCRFYALGMTGDLPEFHTPWESVTCRQVEDLLKLACSISQPYLILAHSADLVTAISMLRELHMAVCL